MTQQSKNLNILTLHHNSIYAESDLEKAKLLNTYFSSQAVADDTNTQLPPIQNIDHSLEFITITTEGVSDVFQHIDTTKARGPRLNQSSFVERRMPYSLHNHTPSSSTVLLNKDISLRHGKTQMSLQFTKKMTNYLPISLWSSVGRTMERCVNKHLYNYMFQINF